MRLDRWGSRLVAIQSDCVTVTIDVPPSFFPFLADAIVRLGFLYPMASFSVGGGQVAVETPEAQANAIRRDLNFGLYRQKVYSENLDLRSKLMEGIMGQ